MKSTEELANGTVVTLLEGHWPEWYGNLGQWFIYIRIRHGACWIGTGRSQAEAEQRSDLVHEDEKFAGVSGIEDAIEELKRAGYTVKSKVVPSHVEEVL